MKDKLVLELHDDIVSVLARIEDINVNEITVEIPEGSVLFDNSISIKLLLKEAEKLGKNLTLETTDSNGQQILAMLDQGVNSGFDGFRSKEISESDFEEAPTMSKRKFSKPKLPAFKVPRLKFPKLNFKLPLIIIAILILLGGVGYALVWRAPEATVRMIVDIDPLTKSLTVKVVGDGANTETELPTLPGKTITASVSDQLTIETTGEKTVGEVAEGKITVYNRTDTEVKLDKGTVITYKEDDSDLSFKLNDDVTIPPETLEDPADLTSPSIPGQADVDVTALEFGEAYNIDNDETLEFEDYKKGELFAKSSGAFEGGSSETVKVVAEEDLTELSAKLKEQLTESSLSSLEKKLSSGTKQIPGSQEVTVSTEDFSAEVGDEEDELTLTQVATATVLTYSESELNKLLDTLVDNLVPDGFVLSDKDREVNVEILGSTDSTALSLTEADLQVTLKAFVVPDINEESIKSDLAGKKLAEAEKVLGGVRNIYKYEIELKNSVPFFQRMPTNTENISINIERK